MARSNRPEDERRDFYLFIDEFQNFSTDAFASILAEARKYRSCLILSHQYIDQLPLPIRQAVFGNAGTLICIPRRIRRRRGVGKGIWEYIPGKRHCRPWPLRGGRETARRMEPTKHRFGQRCCRPLENRVGRKDKLIARSRERFAIRRSVIEDKLNRWISNLLRRGITR